MRKLLASLIYFTIALAAISLLLPFTLGLLAENRCKKIAEIIDTTTPLSTKIVKYKRGWFNSKAIAELSLDKLDLKNKELYQLQITADINHGPVIMDWARFYFAQASVNAQVRLNDVQKEILKRYNSKPIANAKIKIRLNGKTDINFISLPFAYQKDKKSLDWRGLRIETIFSPMYKKVRSKVEFAGLNIEDAERTFHIGKLTSTYYGKISPCGLWFGERNLQAESFTTKSIYDRIIDLKNIEMTNQINENQENAINISTDISIDNININGGTYTQNKLDLDINNINQKAFCNLLKQAISKKVLTSPGSLGIDAAMTLLNDGTEININRLKTSTPWGKSLATIDIAFPKGENDFGIFSIITNSTVNTNIEATRPLVLHLLEKFYKNKPLSKEQDEPIKRADDLLDEWQKTGKISTKDDSDSLIIKFSYKNNQMLINDKPLTISIMP